MQPLVNGIAKFSQAVFTGFVGRCSMKFEARFHENQNPMASDQQSEVAVISVIAETMTVQSHLPLGNLIGGHEYSFSGQQI
jgi:hypothetical protein